VHPPHEKKAEGKKETVGPTTQYSDNCDNNGIRGAGGGRIACTIGTDYSCFMPAKAAIDT